MRTTKVLLAVIATLPAIAIDFARVVFEMAGGPCIHIDELIFHKIWVWAVRTA